MEDKESVPPTAGPLAQMFAKLEEALTEALNSNEPWPDGELLGLAIDLENRFVKLAAGPALPESDPSSPLPISKLGGRE